MACVTFALLKRWQIEALIRARDVSAGEFIAMRKVA